MSQKSLIFEGGDAVGKNTFAIATVTLLLELGEKVIFGNYPQYWLLGYDVRLMNRGKDKELFDRLNINAYEQAKIRAAMYALDRATTLSILASIREQHPDIIHVSDRGPDSNAVTAGYIWATNPDLSPEQLDQFVKEIIGPIDAEMREYLQYVSVLCVTDAVENNALTARESLDDLETPAPQKLAREIYEHKLKLPTIVTKRGNEWGDKNVLCKQALAYLGYSHPNLDEVTYPDDPVPTLLDSLDKEQLLVIGPALVLDLLFPQDIQDELINQNLTAACEIAQQWATISLGKDTINGQNKKTYLDKFEMDLALQFKQLMPYIEWSSLQLPNIGSRAVKRLITEYPLLLDLLSATGGEETVTFVTKLAEYS